MSTSIHHNGPDDHGEGSHEPMSIEVYGVKMPLPLATPQPADPPTRSVKSILKTVGGSLTSIFEDAFGLVADLLSACRTVVQSFQAGVKLRAQSNSEASRTEIKKGHDLAEAREGQRQEQFVARRQDPSLPAPPPSEDNQKRKQARHTITAMLALVRERGGVGLVAQLTDGSVVLIIGSREFVGHCVAEILQERKARISTGEQFLHELESMIDADVPTIKTLAEPSTSRQPAPELDAPAG